MNDSLCKVSHIKYLARVTIKHSDYGCLPLLFINMKAKNTFSNHQPDKGTTFIPTSPVFQ